MKFAQQLFRLFAARPVPRVPAVAPAPLMLALEPRIVYEASLGVVPVAHHAEASHHHVEHAAGAKPFTVPGEGTVPATRAGSGTAASRASELNHKTPLGLSATQIVQPEKQVVFIDPNVTDYQELIAGLTPGTRYVVLNPNTDGLEQIAQYLEQHPGVQAINLISHGSEGEVQVGATWLNANDVSQYSAELAQIGAAMAPGGDFLIYGCDVAEGSNGQTLVQQIASATHLNVAASTDLTGAASLGGDWTLEYEVGVVKTSAIFTAQAEAQYGYVLAETIEDFTSADDAGYDSGATSSFSLDGITYTITKTNGASDNIVTQDTFLQALPDETASDNALLFDEGGTGGTSAITITMQDGRAFNIQSLDIDVVADTTATFFANGQSTGVSVTSDNLGVAQTVELSSANSAFADVTSITIEGGNMEVTLGHIVYSELTPPTVTTTGGATTLTSLDSSSRTPVAIDPGVTVSDTEAATAASATVAITGNFHSGEDVLGFTNTSSTTFGNISASYSAGTGVLTLTSSNSTATIAQWQAALEAVTYLDTAAAPNTAARTISFTLNDGLASSTAVTKTVDVDSPPIVTTSGGTTSYTSGTSATAVDSGVTVTDPSRTTQTSATVTIGTGFENGDTLAFTNTSSTSYGNITASYNATTGVMTLTSSGATATDAQWTDALEAVAFTSDSTSYGDRTVSFVVNDGTDNSVAAMKTVDVTNPDPVLTTDSGSASFVAGDNTASTPVTVDSGLTLTDPGTSTLGSATVAVTGNLHSGEDVLAFTNTNSTTFGNISASYDSSTGVLTLASASASATTAQWQAALDAVTYTDTAITPNNATRTISFTTTDSRNDTSNTATRTVTVTDTDQTPIVTTTGGTTSYVGGTSAVAIDGGVTVSDRDNTTQASGTVSIGPGFENGDTLAFTNTSPTLYGNITASYNATTGVMTLTSSGATATDAQWTDALEAVAFSTASTSYGNRTISFAVNDGTENSAAATKTVDVTNPDPVLTTDSGSAAFVAGDNASSTPVTVDSGLTVTDPGTSFMTSATVAITGNFHSGEDVLAFTNNGTTMGNITGTYNAVTGVLTLTSAGSTSTLAQWQAALDAVTYTDAAITPNNATRTISFTVIDANSDTSNTATRTVTVADVDQTPIVTTTGGTTNYVGGTSAVTIDGGVTVGDLDNTTQASGTVSITTGFHSGDTLSFTNTSSTLFGNIVASYNATTGVLTLTSTGATSTDAQWANAFDAVTFSAASSATPGNRTVSFVVNDGTENSAAATDTVDVLGPPTVTTDAGSAAFVAGDNVASTPVTVDSGVTVTDGGASTLASATVVITGNFHAGEDVLAFTNNGTTMGNISGTYNASTGVLTLTSSGLSATLAQWQAALDAVTYTDTAITPNNATRTISFTVADADSNTSNTATRTVTVADTDQTPIVTTTGGTTNYVGGTSAATIDGGVTVSDLDNTTQASGTVSITTGFHSGDTLSFTNTSAALFGNIVASYNATTGVLTLTSAGATSTDAQWANAFDTVTFSAASSATPGNRTVSFVVSDGIENSATATDTVDVLNPPTVTTDSGSASFTAGDNVTSTPVAIDSGLTVTDGGASTLTSATVAITGNFHSGEDVLSFTNTSTTAFGNISVQSYNASTGVLTLTSSGSSATLAQWQAALDAVTYTDTAITPNTATRTISFTVTDANSDTSNTATRTVTVADVDQTPIVTTTTGVTQFSSGDNTTSTPVVIDSGIEVSDRDNATLASATVSITSGFQSGQDELIFNADAATTGNITGTYNATTGVLTLSSAGASATLAQWQAALDSIQYTNTAITPNAGTRTISFAVNDGTESSALATKDVSVSATDQTPVATGAGTTITYTVQGNGGSPVLLDPGVTLSDRGDAVLTTATVSISNGFDPGQDVLSFTGGAATGSITGSYNATTGVLTLSANGTATLAQWAAAFQAVSFSESGKGSEGVRTLSFTISDGIKTSQPISMTVDVEIASTPPSTTTSTDLPAAVSHPPGEGALVNGPPLPGELAGDSVSNPLIVLDALDQAPAIGVTPSPLTITFTDPNAQHAHLPVDYTSVSAVSPDSVFDSSAADSSMFEPAPVVVDFNAAPDRPFSLNLSSVLPTLDGLLLNATSDVSVQLADGRPLPAWLHYDAATGTLAGVIPAGAHDVRIAVQQRDAAGHVMRSEIVLAPVRQHAHHAHAHSAPHAARHALTHVVERATAQAPLPAGKPSLAQQFAQARAALHVVRPAANTTAAAAVPEHHA